MLQVFNLSKSYGTQTIFDSVAFTVGRGERIGLVGRNGHGKTTLFRLILGEEHPDSGMISIPAGCTIGHLSQHIHFTERTVLEEAGLGLPKSKDHRDEFYKVKSVLMGLGFSNDDFIRPPSQLSGGYQVRLNLAKVLVSRPNLLLLDEPTNYLDIVSIRWLVRFLRSWENELILITHDRYFMDGVTTHTMGIHRTKIKKVSGPTQKLYDQILQEEEVYERTRINDEKKRSEAEQFINRFRAQATRATAVQSRIKALDKRERLEARKEIRDLEFKFRYAPFDAKRLMTIEGLSFSFSHTGPRLIDDLSFSVGRKDRIAVIGKNGRGKTTLLNLMAGELLPQGGEARPHPNARLACFGQTNINRLSPEKTVLQEIMDAHPDRSMGEARNICGAMMFEGDNALKKVSVLSGGERSRVLLGRLLVSPANLLLLDEPTNHLDMQSIDSLIEAIVAFDGAVVIVTHSELILKAVATRLIVFDGGRVSAYEGGYQEFIEQVGWKDETAELRNSRETAKNSAGAIGKKDIRRMRAEIISGRSRIVGALQADITSLEQTIMQLEQIVEQDMQALLVASANGDGEAIKSLSKSIHESKQKIEGLFLELDTLTQEHDTKAKEFEMKLSELQDGA